MTAPSRAVCQACPWEGPEHERIEDALTGDMLCPACGTDEVAVYDRTADDIPAEVPFVEQHRAGPVVEDQGEYSITCACGEVCSGIGTHGAARRAHGEHLTRAARLTIAQAEALTAAAADSRGRLPESTPRVTHRALVDHGLIEQARPGDTPTARSRISGVGLGVLAEYRRRRP